VALEMLVLFVRDEIAKPTIGEPEYKKYTPYLLSTFFVILFANLLGVLPYTATATGNVAVTAALAICTFVITQYASIKSAGIGGYLAHLSGGAPWWLLWLMVPIEILGLFTKPFALCLRLFANMVAGHFVIFYLLGLIFILKTLLIAPVSVFLAVCIYLLEIFVAFLQAYVFTILSSLFIGMGVAMGHHGHEDHHHAEHDPHVAP
jgi:F-type H+-transporting ATPase subunit a